MFGPIGRKGHAAGRRQPAVGDQFENAAADAGGQPIIVGAQNEGPGHDRHFSFGRATDRPMRDHVVAGSDGTTLLLVAKGCYITVSDCPDPNLPPRVFPP
jgi:hypothetical protein